MDDITKSILEEADNQPYQPAHASHDSGRAYAATSGDSGSFITGFGLVVAICAAALLFGGETFIWWTVSWELENVNEEEDGYALEAKFELKHGMDEGYEEINVEADFNEEGYETYRDKSTNTTKWDDEDCTTDDKGTEDPDDDTDSECTELLGFFTNLKYMVYGLLVCGLALVYVGQTGQEEHASTLAVVGALISAGLLVYTFVALPPAFEEDTEFFEDSMNEDPAFFMNSGKEEYDDTFETDIKSYSKAMPGVAYFIPVITLTLFGYLLYNNRD